MRPLYQITAAYQAALEACYEGADDGDGSIPQELADALNSRDQEFAAKVEQCCRMLADMNYRHDMLKQESDMLAARARAVANQRDWLRDYVKSQLESVGKLRIRAGLFDVSVQRNSQPVVVIDDETQVPDSFFRTERVLEKTGIRMILQEGGAVDGAHLETGTHLRIR